MNKFLRFIWRLNLWFALLALCFNFMCPPDFAVEGVITAWFSAR